MYFTLVPAYLVFINRHVMFVFTASMQKRPCGRRSFLFWNSGFTWKCISVDLALVSVLHPWLFFLPPIDDREVFNWNNTWIFRHSFVGCYLKYYPNSQHYWCRISDSHAVSCQRVCLLLFFHQVEPSVRLKSADAAGSKHQRMLICSVHGFYPKHIRVTWQKNGNNVTSDVTSTDELSNGNWLYQIHSYLEFTPKTGEKITCMVEHASLPEPKLYEWGKSDRRCSHQWKPNRDLFT